MLNHLESINKAKEIITSVKGKHSSLEELKDLAIELTALILKESHRLQTETEKQQQAQLARLMEDPMGKVFTSSMTDQCFRSQIPARTADQLIYLIRTLSIPKYLSSSKRYSLRLFNWFGRWMPKLFVSMAKQLLRQETSGVIIPGEEESLAKHIAKRRKEGVRININHLGEAILGEAEAFQRLNIYLDDLKNPNIEYISIKISTIYSQLNSVARAHTLEVLTERLKKLYRTAQENVYVRPDGVSVPKFVNLDMEEYRDLHLTADLFCQVLSEPEFLNHSAGIVLQSYLPDAYPMQQKLTEWAIQRCHKGGAPIKIRIVKGANLSMEMVESSLKNWPLATYSNKLDVDANYKQMLTYGCRAEHAKAVHLGIASHNIFDSSLAILLRAQHNLEATINFEMLEGMADHVRRAIQMLTGEILLYCPTATKDDFQNAIAYLIRRLDENTAPDNFLRHLFGLRPGTKDWENQTTLFNNACKSIDAISNSPRRIQNRSETAIDPDISSAFDNEADTDWALPQNSDWANEILEHWQGKVIEPIPLAIGGQFIQGDEPQGMGDDPSRPGRAIYRYNLATSAQADLAVESAIQAQKDWSKSTPIERSHLLAAVARQLRIERGALIGAMVLDGGKTVQEADVEISEAIDFAEYYRRNIEEVYCLDDIHWEPKGTILIAPPWNFPCSIPAGCIMAALATGNAVIFKPAPQTVLVGWQLVQAFWKAGVNEKLLQFLTCTDDPVGSNLIKNSKIGAVLLTGATATAKMFLKMRPDIDLIAETGGKNSMIISNLSDRDLAIKELLSSAFGHSGQKCSACSLAILEAEVYDDPHFRKQLRDAAISLTVGSAWVSTTKINPLIEKPSDVLQRGLTQLDEGEEWLLKPVQDEKNSQLWSPGIKFGVKEGSFTHQTELFGPVLGIMRADHLAHAIKLANGTPYGLTAGLHSLDLREQQLWMEKIEAGNCYINRSVTGAIVQRQPFGGYKASSFGRGSKAGGPNYLMQLMHPKEKSLPAEKNKLSDAVAAISAAIPTHALSPEMLHLWQISAGNYAFYWNGYFSKDHDPSRLIGQDNFLRYRPHTKMTLRFDEKDALVNILRVAAAATTVGCPLEISASKPAMKLLNGISWPKTPAGITLIAETEEQLHHRISEGSVSRLRMLSAPNATMQKVCAESSCYLQIVPVVANGRVELLNFLREISFSIDYHRYGYLGARESEKRKSLL